MNIHSAARALGGEVRDGGIVCPGPNHSAADRSLSVKFFTDAPDGFVVNSFAGDDAIACRDHVRDKLSLGKFQPRANGRSDPAKFDYRDPVTGDVRYSKLRLESRGGRDKRIWFEPKKRGGSEPLLYGGERLAKHPKDKAVFIVEGENKVDRLAQFGAVAVSCDTGAESNWLPSHAELQDIDEARVAVKKAVLAVERVLIERGVDDYLRARSIDVVVHAIVWGDLPASPDYILEGAIAEALDETDTSRRCNRAQ